MRSYQNVRLVPRTDPHYLSFCSGHANLNLRLGPPTPGGNRMDVARWIEDCCRSELKTAFTLVDKDIIVWQKKTASGRLIQCYKEVDGVFQMQDAQKALLLVEIKSSQSKSSIHLGKQQVKKNAQLLQATGIQAKSLLVLTDCHELDAVLAQPCLASLETGFNEAPVFHDFGSFFAAERTEETQVILLDHRSVSRLVLKYGHPEDIIEFNWWDEI